MDEDPEVAAPEARVSRPEGAAREPMRSKAPEAEASEARVGGPEAGAEEPPWSEAPEVANPEAPTALGAGGHATGFGQLCLNFKALRKGKGSPRCSRNIYRSSKQRKYIAIDE